MEKEGKEYEDKDTFLTSAYRKKLEERREMEEELKQEEKREGEYFIDTWTCCMTALWLDGLTWSTNHSIRAAM